MAPEWFVCGLLSGRWKKIEVSEGWGGLDSPDSTRVPKASEAALAHTNFHCRDRGTESQTGHHALRPHPR